MAAVLFDLRGGAGVVPGWERRYDEGGLPANSLGQRGNGSFFGTLKSEFFYLNAFDSVACLEKGLHQYIHYYDHECIKTKLKGLSPVHYRTQPSVA